MARGIRPLSPLNQAGPPPQGRLLLRSVGGDLDDRHFQRIAA